MTVRAKFKCNSVEKRAKWNSSNSFIYDAKFTAVTDNSEENKKFFEATPNGNITLGTLRDDFFQPGIEYYIDITEAV